MQGMTSTKPMNRAERDRIAADGACGPADWTTMVSDDPADQTKAKLTCQSCQVRDDCLSEFYLEVGIVVGGMTWNERKKNIVQGALPAHLMKPTRDVERQGGIKGLQWTHGLSADEAAALARILKGIAA